MYAHDPEVQASWQIKDVPGQRQALAALLFGDAPSVLPADDLAPTDDQPGSGS